jgi:DNA primase
MAKISPVSIKYMIYANFNAEGALEKPDVIGAIFGQTEGLLGNDLEMRELQKEGKIGRIEVDLERGNKRTIGKIKIPTALDQSETSLVAAAIETIERIGPSDAQIEIEKIEDVRGNKRDYIVERAKKLMQNLSGATDSREISRNIKDSVKTSEIKEYGREKLPCGDISGHEVIVVEGRADVVNMVRNGVDNVIGMNGTKLPEAIRELGEEKELTLFVDGDRGGKLIVQNVSDNANLKYVTSAPDGKEVEELTGKEILQALRKKVPVGDFLSRSPRDSRDYRTREPSRETYQRREVSAEKKEEPADANRIEKIKKISEKNDGTGKAVLLDSSLNEMKTVSVKLLSSTINKMREKPSVIIIDGTATIPIIRAAEDSNSRIIAAKNFGTTDTKIQLLSF